MSTKNIKLACTLTGVDEVTSVSGLVALSAQFDNAVEWGFLYSPKQAGMPGRYPSVSFLTFMLETLPQAIPVALHVCGAGVPNLLASEPEVTKLFRLLQKRNGRLQLNFNYKRNPAKFPLPVLIDFIKQAGLPVIVQAHAGNAAIFPVIQGLPNVAVLFDSSGGQGIECANWPDALPLVACGYAGGLGPDNLATTLPLIYRAGTIHGTHLPLWVDMESKLRNTKDVFDLDLAEQCLQHVSNFNKI